MPSVRNGLSGTFTTFILPPFQFRCEAVTHGVTIVASETQGRVQNSYNPMYVIEQPFSVTAVCSTEDEYESLMNWVETCKNASTTSIYPVIVQVTVPSRGFSEIGILSQGGTRGQQVGEYVWHVPLSFEPCISPLDTSLVPAVSQFVASKTDPTDAPWFYPSSVPIPDSVEAQIYGPTPIANGAPTDVEGNTNAQSVKNILEDDRHGVS